MCRRIKLAKARRFSNDRSKLPRFFAATEIELDRLLLPYLLKTRMPTEEYGEEIVLAHNILL